MSIHIRLEVFFTATILLAANAQSATIPPLLESFPAPGAASQLSYSKQYGLLFLRNSGSAVRVIDTSTHAQIDLHLANQQFTDMDLTPDGKYLYVADWGHVVTGYGNQVNPHYVHRYNLAARQWETKQSPVDTYKLEAVDDDRILLLESDQWVSVNLESWGTGSSLSTLNSAGADYDGDIEYDPVTGRVYHGNSGSSSHEINVLRLVGNSFSSGVGSGIYGTAQSGGGTSVLSPDGSRFYYGPLQVEALDVTHDIRTFAQPIYAATNSLAFGSSAIYDAQTGTSLGSFGYSTTVYGLDTDGSDLWTYANGTLYHYGQVPEPASLMIALPCAMVFLSLRMKKPRRV
jgi:hypothetical protein